MTERRMYTSRRVCYNCDQVVLIKLPFRLEFLPYDKEHRSANIESGYFDGVEGKVVVECPNCGLPRLT